MHADLMLNKHFLILSGLKKLRLLKLKFFKDSLINRKKKTALIRNINLF